MENCAALPDERLESELFGYKKGRILNYQIIAPTNWIFSPRDAQGTPGALEQALIGKPVPDGEQDPVAVQHIVRWFDPYPGYFMNSCDDRAEICFHKGFCEEAAYPRLRPTEQNPL